MSSARFASDPMACLAASRSPHCAKWTMAGRQTLATSILTEGSNVTLHKQAATSRCISNSADSPDDAREGNPPACTKRRRFSGSLVNLRRAAKARHCEWMLFDCDRYTKGGTPPARPICANKSGSEARFATLNVAYSRTAASCESAANLINTFRVPLDMTAGWFASFDVTLTRHISAWRWESTSSSLHRSSKGCKPPWTMICTCVTGKFAMLPRQIQAYRRISTSKSFSKPSAACRPPPFVATLLVWMFAAKLDRDMIAKRLQSTSTDPHNLINAEVALAWTKANWLAAAQEMLYNANAAERWTSNFPSSLDAIATRGGKAPALTKGTLFILLDAKLHRTKPANLAHSGKASASMAILINGRTAPCRTTCSWFDFSFVKLDRAMAAYLRHSSESLSSNMSIKGRMPSNLTSFNLLASWTQTLHSAIDAKRRTSGAPDRHALINNCKPPASTTLGWFAVWADRRHNALAENCWHESNCDSRRAIKGPSAPNLTIVTWFFVTVAKLPTAIAASRAQFSSGFAMRSNKAWSSSGPKTPTWLSGWAEILQRARATSIWMPAWGTRDSRTSGAKAPSRTSASWLCGSSARLPNKPAHCASKSRSKPS
mmetsp:Transcript_15584/g.40991  ORF Transcript_15584/g.40991 Transcript_15584/m.40991 type:complete len:602 (-) Transcript_15584:774-2579(-)